jgi:hypothetical protein
MDPKWTVSLDFSEYWFNDLVDPEHGRPVEYGTWA